jgi:hypothetical protein
LTDDPIRERCLEEDEWVTLILCDGEASSSWNQVTTMTPPYTKSYITFQVWN